MHSWDSPLPPGSPQVGCSSQDGRGSTLDSESGGRPRSARLEGAGGHGKDKVTSMGGLAQLGCRPCRKVQGRGQPGSLTGWQGTAAHLPPRLLQPGPWPLSCPPVLAPRGGSGLGA